MSDEAGFMDRVLGRLDSQEGDSEAYEADDVSLHGVEEEEAAAEYFGEEAGEPDYISKQDFESAIGRYEERLAQYQREMQQMLGGINQRVEQVLPKPEAPEPPPSLEDHPIDALAYGLKQNQERLDQLMGALEARSSEENWNQYVGHINGTVAQQVQMVEDPSSETPLPDYKDAAKHLVSHLVWELKSHNPGMPENEVAAHMERWWLNWARDRISSGEVVPFAVYDYAMRVGYQPQVQEEEGESEATDDRMDMFEKQVAQKRQGRMPDVTASDYRVANYDVDDLESLSQLSVNGSYGQWASQFADPRERFEAIKRMQAAAYGQ